MNIIKRLWHDIRTGQNIDVYITIITSITVATLGILGIVNQTIIFSALLAIMALIASSMLVNRHQNEEIRASLLNLKETRSLSSREVFQEEDDITEHIQTIRNSQKIILWGYTLTTHIPILKEEIEKGLDRGLEVRILLIKPSGIALKMAAFRGSKTTENNLNFDLERNLERLADISNTRPGVKFEYRVIDYFAPYTIYIFDPHLPNGKMMVRLSTLRVPNARRPTYYLTRKNDESWFLFHVDQFETAWRESVPWKAIPVPNGDKNS